jgi:hypothetical protein
MLLLCMPDGNKKALLPLREQGGKTGFSILRGAGLDYNSGYSLCGGSAI